MELLRILERAGFESVLVGGAVRDILLERAPVDADIATEASFSALAALFPGGKPVGPRGKTVFLVPGEGGRCEISSFNGGSLEADLARRDFTVNALALRSTGELVGTRRSRRDIALRILRFNGRSADRLAEDPLRALRLARFASTLPGFSTHRSAFSGVRSAAPSLERCAAERIGREMRLGLAGDPCVFLRSLAACRLLYVLRPLRGADRGGLLLPLVSLRRLDGGVEPLLRRTALLASCGRNAACPDPEGEAEVRRVLVDWRWPARLSSGVSLLVRWRSVPAARQTFQVMASLLLEHGAAFMGSLFALADAVPRDAASDRRIAANRERFAVLSVRFGNEKECIPSGDELMERFSLSPGPEVGGLLYKLRMEHLLRGFPTREKALERGAELLRRR